MKLPFAAAATAVLLGLAAYLPSLEGSFFADDRVYVVENEALRAIPLTRPWRFFTARTNPFELLPVRDLSLRFDLALFGDDPLGYRLHNLLLYGVCCLLMWPLARRVLADRGPGERGTDRDRSPRRGTDGGESPTRGPGVRRPGVRRPGVRKLTPGSGVGDSAGWAAPAVVAVFALHPAHVESVAWISGRKELLSGLLAILALWWFCVALDRSGRWRLAQVGSVLAFVLANLSKSTVVPAALVAVFLALDRGDRSRTVPQRLRRAVLAALPLLLVAAGSVTLHVAVGGRTGVLAEAAGGPALAPVAILGTLTRIALVPVRLRLIYDLEEPGAGLLLAYGLGLAAAAAAGAAVWILLRRRSPAAVGVVSFVLLCLPFLQMLPFRTWSLVSERFLFLPLLGLALATGAAVRKVPRRTAAVAAVAVCALLLTGTFARSRDWASGRELVAGNARWSPRHHLAASAWINDGLLPEGRFDEAADAASKVRDEPARRFLERYVEARRALAAGDRRRAAEHLRWLVAAPSWDDPTLELQLANLALEAGMSEEAAAIYRAVLEERPASAEIRYNLGLALKRLGRLEEALPELEAAVAGGVASADAGNNLGLVYRDLGEPERAEHAFLEALEADPRHWHAAYNLARMHLRLGDAAAARSLLGEARRRALAAGDDPRPIDELIAGLDRPP